MTKTEPTTTIESATVPGAPAPGAATTPGAVPAGVASAQDAPAASKRSSDANWSKPVDRLTLGEVPASAINLNVEGRRLVGPMQGFGQLWQKRYRVRLESADATPEQVIRGVSANSGRSGRRATASTARSPASPRVRSPS